MPWCSYRRWRVAFRCFHLGAVTLLEEQRPGFRLSASSLQAPDSDCVLASHIAATDAIWLQVVLLAMDLTTWDQQLALTGTWRVAQPKTLRLKLFATAARTINAARRRIIDLDPDWPWAAVVHDALQQLAWLARLSPA